MRRLVPLWALCALVAGCEVGTDGDGSEPIGASSLYDPVAINPSLCGGGAIPFPNNALFADATNPPFGVTTDGTLNIPSTASTAVAANLTDGFSTTASAFTDVLGVIDYASATDAVIVIEADASPRILAPGIDYTIQPSIAMAQMSGTGGLSAAGTVCPAVQGNAAFAPISLQRSRILIEPLIPLNASTTYLVAVTKQLKSADGVTATAADMFEVANSDTRICRLATDASASDPLCSDSAAPAYAATLAPALISANATQLTTLESLRRGLVRPTVQAFQYFHNTVLSQPAITDDDLVIAWSFTTQSVGATLQTLNAITSAKTFSVVDSTLSTADLGIPGTDASIWVGTFNAVPYYLNDAASATDVASQLDYWRNNGVVTTGAGAVVPPIVYDNDNNPATPSVPAPCTGAPFNFAVPVSTTNCYRIPAEQSTENLPVVITVPPGAKPDGGWPVVIFQHGITGHRGQMLPLGATLAGAGFVTIAIDLPLHGILDGDPLFDSLRQDGNERTFDLDISAVAAGNACLSAPTGDGNVDTSGACFINLGSLATTRDNLRQAVADLIHLSKSLGDSGLSFDGSAGNDLNLSTGIRYAGLSLGSIVGTTLLGVDTGSSGTTQDGSERISSASLSVPGGGLAKLLDASKSFGPRIAAGLAGGALSPAPNGVPGFGAPYEGTDTYETFVRFAQHLTDPGDPINFAVAANANHRIHMTMVENDTVVPNSALTTCPPGVALPDPVVATANTPNSATRLAACRAGGLLVGADTPATGGNMVALCPGIATVGACPGTAGQDETLISGFLSGTEPLYGLMGLDVEGPLTPPAMATSQDCTNGLDVLVHFAIGSHGSLLDTTASVATTVEMQRQAAAYLYSNGYSLVTGGCP